MQQGNIVLSATLLLLTAILPDRARAQAATADLPVREVMLFSSGVGYFEHRGTVTGNSSSEVRFKTSQINDILKSLVFQDLDGGSVSAISYPSQDPIGKALRSFQVDITANPTLAELLNQLRGASVTVQNADERVSGTVLGVESRREVVPGGSVQVNTLNILGGAMIRAIKLDEIVSLSLDDPQLQDELTRALAALSQARDQEKKPVTINFTGTGQRRVSLGYVVEAPVWKASYRLLLDRNRGYLQGWAIVENQTENDWNGVSLSLVSGRPISFVMDLYQPLYATRPAVEQQMYAGLSPQSYGAATSDASDVVQMGAAGRAGGDAGGRGGGGGGRGGVPAELAMRPLRMNAVVTTGVGDPAVASAPPVTTTFLKAEEMASTVQSIASAAQMGELFKYNVSSVSIPRQKSAMLPIVTDSVAIERISIYNAAVLRQHPLNGVRVTNSTNNFLLQGPVTVLDSGSYAGDAQIDNIPPGQRRMLSFGVDLQLLVDSKTGSSTNEIRSARIMNGFLSIERKFVSAQEYRVDNKGDRSRVVVIEHPVRGGWILLDSARRIESTPTVHRFEGTAEAGKVTVLTVREQNVGLERLALVGHDLNALLHYSRSGEIPSAVRSAITRAVQLREAVVAVEREIADRGKRVDEITAEQNRIRENMKTVAPTTQYYQRLLAKLNEQESTIETLQIEQEDLRERLLTQRAALTAYLDGLEIG